MPKLMMKCPYGHDAGALPVKGKLKPRYGSEGLLGNPEGLKCAECERVFVQEVHTQLLYSDLGNLWGTPVSQEKQVYIYELDGPWQGQAIQIFTVED